MRRVLLIRNPTARRGVADLTPVYARLAGSRIAVLSVAPARAEDVTAAILGHRGQVDAVVVAGGDGSLNAAAPGLLEAGLPFGILPLGTANDLARTLAIPSDPVAAVAIVASGLTRALDVGSVNARPFFNVASIGPSASLARTLTGAGKRRWGRLGYAGAGLRVLARARPFQARIIHAGVTAEVRTWQIAVGNGRHYGGGNVVATAAAIDDARLDLYSLEFTSAWKLPLMLPAFRTGAHGTWREVRTMRGVAFDVATRRPRPVNADGELVTETPAQFRVHPAALRVFVPDR